MKISITKIIETIPADAGFYISHMADKRGRLYSGSSDMAHMSGKDAKLVTVFAPAPFDRDQELDNAGKFMNSRDGEPMEKWSSAKRLADVIPRLGEIIGHASDPMAAGIAAAAYDEPQRYMQAAIAIAAGVAAERSGETALSGTVAASDGSCSGLQHINGGMIRNHAGAADVNLTSQESRSDIYEILRDHVVANWNPTKGSAEAIEFATDLIAKGAMTRKVVKLSMMTLTYGSSDGKVREDVRDKLADAGWVDLDDPIQYEAAYSIMGGAVVDGRKAKAGRAMGAMAFLKKVVEAVYAFDNVEGVVKWSTGNGIFHNRRVERSVDTTSTYYKGVETRSGRGVLSNRLHLSAMVSAIAPNFVHSYDAAHLQNVVLACAAEQPPIPLIVIHDSFNSTPNNYVRMNEIIRSEFVKLYENNNPLENMLALNKDNMSPADFDSLSTYLDDEIMVGDYDVTEIIGNEFAFA